MPIKITAAEKLNFISSLGTMLTAGISLLDAVESLQEEAKGNVKKVLTMLQDDITQGRKISDSIEKFPGSFDSVDVHLIHAAEEAGTLDTTLKDLTITIKKEMELAEKVRSALTYPMIVVVVFFAIMAIILIAVVPKIAKVFLQLKLDLPLPTRVLIWMSDALLQNTVFFLGGIIGSIILGIFIFRTQKKRVVKLMFSLPILSSLGRDIDLTRFARSLSLLLDSGIPIVNALELVSEIVVRQEMVEVVLHARDVISRGESVAQALKDRHSVVPPLVVRITQAGEKTGTLSRSLQDVAEYFDGQVTRRVKVLTTMLEPVLLVIIAGTVGGMMLSIIAPIYSLIGQISAR